MYIAERTDTPCQTSNPEFWFAKPGTREARSAVLLCYRCPLRIECLNSAVRYEEKLGETQLGIYGGMNRQERKVFLTLAVSA